MRTADDLKNYVATLVETNRALASDLDASRRIVASIGRERDSLRGELEQLQSAQRPSPARPLEAFQQDVERLTDLLAEERTELTELRQLQSQLRRAAEDDKLRLRQAEERLAAMVVQLHRVEQERDTARLELDEATSAMAEIRSCLQSSLQDAWNAEDAGFGSYL